MSGVLDDRLDVDAEAPARRGCVPERQRFALPFAVTGSSGSYSKSFSRRAVRALADDDPADGRMLLQPRGGVDDVAGDDAFAFRGPRAERDHRLAGVHRAAHCELEVRVLVVELVDRVEDPQCRVHRALRIVLVRDRRTEHRHDRVADELLDRPAEPLDLLLHARVVRTQARADILGIGLLGRRGEADEVDEEDGDDLALFGCPTVALRRARRRTTSRSAPARGSPRRTFGQAGIHRV